MHFDRFGLKVIQVARRNNITRRASAGRASAYSREHRSERGLFFLGAGHRRTIIDKIQKYAVKELPRLAWNYDQYERIMGNA